MMEKQILIVDDEKNIRLTVSRSLADLGVSVQSALNGEEALQKLDKDHFDLIFLDLKMPGMDGMELLRLIEKKWPESRVIIVTAFGTIENAVEAIKLGAVDFIQKPFSPEEIRQLTKQVIDRDLLNEEKADDYFELIELTKRNISDKKFDKASESARKAIASAPDQPEAYNLLGALMEIKREFHEAAKYYRAALNIDPTYKPAWANLERVTSWNKFGEISLGTNSDEIKFPKEDNDIDKNEK